MYTIIVFINSVGLVKHKKLVLCNSYVCPEFPRSYIGKWTILLSLFCFVTSCLQLDWSLQQVQKFSLLSGNLAVDLQLSNFA